MVDPSFDTLAAIIGALGDAGMEHMVAGSIASSHHGIARLTADIDLVIDPTPELLDRFLDRVDTDRFYVPVDFERETTRSRDQFNVVDKRTGWKVDLVIRKDRPFSRSEFGRRQPVDLAGIDVFVATAEDTVLAKLEWAASTDSDRQIRDVADLLRTIGEQLDHGYLEQWADELRVRDALDRARRAARRDVSNGPVGDT